jgi:hypothetical protein
VKASAVLSPGGSYRYLLSREWDEALPRCLFIMLNPSTADATQDDPTIRRCIGFAKAWGYGTLDVCNLFAWRATDPKALLKVADPVGPENDAHIRRAAAGAGLVVCAWGNHGMLMLRGKAVNDLLRREGIASSCLGVTGTGQPKHPLYLRGDSIAVQYGGPS